jgi:hypothetical protein
MGYHIVPYDTTRSHDTIYWKTIGRRTYQLFVPNQTRRFWMFHYLLSKTTATKKKRSPTPDHDLCLSRKLLREE